MSVFLTFLCLETLKNFYSVFLTIHRVHIQLNLIKVPKVVESVHSGCSSSVPVSSSLPPYASDPGKAMKCAQFLALFFLHVKHVFFLLFPT